MNKNGEPNNSVDTNGHHVLSNTQTKKRKNRPPLLTHINKKKKPVFIPECNTTNVTPINSHDDTTNREDWNLISNNKTDKVRGTLINGGANVGIAGNLTSNNGRNTFMKALIDGSANGGIAGTEDSRQLNSTFNCGRSVKVTRLGESTIQNVPIEVICAVSESINVPSYVFTTITLLVGFRQLPYTQRYNCNITTTTWTTP